MRKHSVFLLLTVMIMGIVPVTYAVDTIEITPDIIIGGTQGSDNGQFDDPDSVYIAADGTIYAGDTDNLRVQIFDEDGTYLDELTGFTSQAGNEVQGIGQIANGTIVVVEKVGFLYYFDPVTKTNIAKIDLDTAADLGVQVDTQGLAVNPDNDNILITNQPEHMLLVFDSNGTFIEKWTTGSFTTPENIVVDTANDLIYVSLEAQGNIGVFYYNGTKITTFGASEAVQNFEGLAFDPFGNLLAVDEGGGDISRIVAFDTTSHQAIFAWGGTPGSGQGHFESPDGLGYDTKNNRLFIADQGNHRIQGFNYANVLTQVGKYTAPSVSDESDITVNEADLPYDVSIDWIITSANTTGSYEVAATGLTGADDGGDFVVGSTTASYSATVSSVGTFTFTISTTDQLGETATDTVTVTVEESSSTPKTSDTADSSFFWFSGIAALFVIRKRHN